MPHLSIYLLFNVFEAIRNIRRTTYNLNKTIHRRTTKTDGRISTSSG